MTSNIFYVKCIWLNVTGIKWILVRDIVLMR